MNLQEMVDGVASRRSAQTAKHARNVLSAALRQAVTWGIVPRLGRGVRKDFPVRLRGRGP